MGYPKTPLALSHSGDAPTEWTRFVPGSTFGSAVVVTSSENSGDIEVRIDGGTTQAVSAGMVARWRDIDLYRLEFRGSSAGQSLTFSGEAG